MFRKMRRFKQQLTQEEAEQILKTAQTGVLAVHGDDGYPYTVPVNHVYENGKIAFHCAKEGHKIDAIRRNDKVSFCVVAEDTVMPKERSTAYISVIAFGRARIVDDEDGLRKIATAIGKKFAPDFPEDCAAEIEEVLAANRMLCVEITVEHLTGKCGRQVLLRRQENRREPEK